MEDKPIFSPWGEIQDCTKLYSDIFMVSTAGHGGIMIKIQLARELLSPEAQKCGFCEKGYLNFEEDVAENIPLRELLDKKLWEIPDNIADKKKYEESINNSLQKYFPKYCQEREKRLSSITNEKRYIVYDFLIGIPILIDSKTKTISCYFSNMHGQLYNLENPDVTKVTMKTINGLISRTHNHNYGSKIAKVYDCYIYKYLMTTGQQNQCGKRPMILLSEKIIETNDYKQAIRKMCEWSYKKILQAKKRSI